LQRLGHVLADALDVDVKLILAARMFGIQRHPDRGSRYAAADDRRHQIARRPGGGKIIRRAGFEELRALHAGEGPRGYQEKMRAAFSICEHREAVAQMGRIRQDNALAGRGTMLLQPVNGALALNYLAQRVAVGGCGRGKRNAQTENACRSACPAPVNCP
jgi:hypothetical protein